MVSVLDTFAMLCMLLPQFLEAGIHFQILETPCGIGRSWISCPADNGSKSLCLQWLLQLSVSCHFSLCVALRASLCLSEWKPEPQRISPDFKKQAVQRKQWICWGWQERGVNSKTLDCHRKDFCLDTKKKISFYILVKSLPCLTVISASVWLVC